MSSPFIGEIRMFGCNFAPRSFAFCQGQLLSIAQNTALFSILGTTYGGNGTTNFGLPDLRGRVPIHPGAGGGGNYVLGELGGAETQTLSAAELGSHTHTPAGSTATPDAASPANNYWAAGGSQIYATSATPSATMHANALGNSSGGGQPHSNMQPYLATNFCIALFGIFPSRN